MNYVSASVTGPYRRAAEAIGLLSAQEERMLAERYRAHKDTHSLHRLTVAHQHLVVRVLKKFRYAPNLQEDLMQQGNIGLMIAAEKFEPERGFRFSTYAYNWVMASMQEYANENSSIVRRSRNGATVYAFKNARKAMGYENKELDPEGFMLIAQEMDTSVDKVIALTHKLNTRDSSLSAPIGDDSSTSWEDQLVSTEPNAEERVQAGQARSLREEWIAKAFETLTDREQGIVQARMLDEEPKTLEDLSHVYGVSRERIRQIEQAALEKIKSFIKRNLNLRYTSTQALYDPDLA